MKHLILILCLLSGGISFSQTTMEEGAYNVQTGRQLSFEEWQALLPDQFDLFAKEKPIELKLETDFKKFNKEKFKGNKQQALLHLPLNDSITIRKVIRIEPRGQFRRKYCNPPPIKLNFKKTKIYVDNVQDFDKMKMVSSCKRSKSNEEYVLKEYLTYQLYGLFTEMSFNARLVNVTYVDTGWKKPKTTTSYAFLIEEVDDIVKRNDVLEIEPQTATMKNVIDEEMAMVAMFNYMIGNTDWSVTGLHNVKLFRSKDAMAEKAHIVPYDFDYSGLVNATYAIPSDNFNLSNVRERLFRSECYSKELFQRTMDTFIEKKPEVLRTINEFNYASSTVRKDVEQFIKQFYSQIEGKSAVTFFTSNCGKFL